MTGKITYRDDEIVAIFAGCKTSEDLDKAIYIIGYLNTLGVQTHRPVVAKLYSIRSREIQN